MDIFALKPAQGPWGDYSQILAHGMSKHRARVENRIQLERTGPFVPPVSLPSIGDFIVTDGTRLALERAGLSGFSLAPVDKVHVARVDWENWDRKASEPRVLPPSLEPADYILGSPHDAAASREMGALWEVILSEHGAGEREVVGKGPRRVYRITLSIDGSPPDLFRARGLGYVFVTLRAREWLEKNAVGWVDFQRVEVREQ